MIRSYFTKTNLIRLALAFVCLAPVAFFLELADDVLEHDTLRVDTAILHWAHSFANPTLDHLMVFITELAGPEAIVVITILSVAILYRLKYRTTAFTLAVGVGGAAALNILLKLSFQRVRPDLWVPIVHETSFSFPSGHAMVSSALALTLMIIAWSTRWRWTAIMGGITYTLFIGFTRIYLGVHYPSDIIGGWAISLAWVTIMGAIIHQRRAGHSLRALIWPWSSPK